jgi:DNA-binding FadR family transcriptional regulator
MTLLKSWGLIEVSRGQRARVLASLETTGVAHDEPATERASSNSRSMLDMEIVCMGEVVRRIRAEADPDDAAELRQILLDGLCRLGDSETEIGKYELNIRHAGHSNILTTFVATARTRVLSVQDGLIA